MSQTGILVLLGITLLVTLALAARLIARPLARLTAVTRRIAGGDWSDRAPAAGVAELRELAGDFNEMADAVEGDLAGRRRAELQARDASERLRTIADRVPGAVFQFHVGVDGGLSVRFASRDGSVHGVSDHEEVDFPSVARAVDADDRGAWIDSMVAVARAGGPWRHEYRIRTRAGEVRWMQAQAIGQPAGDGSGELYGYVADVTERKALEVQLRRAREDAESADRAKSAFLAMMSHELRTPLVAVTGTLEVLALGDLDGDQRALVDVATRSARALLGVIGDVLDFSKIEAGHLDLAPVPTALGALVEDVVTQYRLAAPGDGVALRCTLDPALAAAHEVDPVRLRQVLGNLVGNAVKFTRAGSIEVRVSVLGERGGRQDVALEVQDTGIGVSAEDRARLFAPFEQAGTDAARRAGGTGLGLVICRQLVEAMGGSVEMASELGAGTTMRVELPLAVAEGVSGGPEGGVAVRRALPSRADAEREGSLLLLVEDHPVNREILALQLEAIGFQTDTAGDAGEAVAQFERARYGLVFTDIQLPGADGYELSREPARAGGSRGARAGAGRRADGERAERRARAVRGGRHGRRRREASDARDARRDAAALAARRAVAGRRTPARRGSPARRSTSPRSTSSPAATRSSAATSSRATCSRSARISTGCGGRCATATPPACAARRTASRARAARSARTRWPSRRRTSSAPRRTRATAASSNGSRKRCARPPPADAAARPRRASVVPRRLPPRPSRPSLRAPPAGSRSKRRTCWPFRTTDPCAATVDAGGHT